MTVPGEPALARIVDRFGPAFLRPDGSLDRAALGRAVFPDQDALADLERIVHPEVRRVIEGIFAAAERDGAVAVVVEAIKLVEGGLAATCDEVWLVSCTHDGTADAPAAPRALRAGDRPERLAAQAGLDGRVRPFGVAGHRHVRPP